MKPIVKTMIVFGLSVAIQGCAAGSNRDVESGDRTSVDTSKSVAGGLDLKAYKSDFKDPRIKNMPDPIDDGPATLNSSTPVAVKTPRAGG